MKKSVKEIVNKSIPVAMQRARGLGRIATQFGPRGTRLLSLYQDGCAKIRLPNTHSQALEAVLINTAGGLTGGDTMEWRAEASPDSHLVLTTQACERIYKSTGDVARVATRLIAGENAHIDWLPQETILFDASKLSRTIDIDLAQGATLTAVEAVLLGRDAMGEEARNAQLTDQWRIRRNGRLIHAEANQLCGTSMERDGISLLAGMRAFATILRIAPDAAARLDRIRQLLPDDTKIAASAIGDRLIIRALAPNGLALRRLIVPLIAQLSGGGGLPRLWHT
ncbi:urease accessory protein UreD [Devosia rhodophyticola]|uniref:Urease accessory protein UreD n=1 Tax=Devosia rhodophyticola TaxID=3026423 RepID=A0ABY7YVB4_9HYPH|nr:urease accessory protein UreD [Devosia rhodophyticola]WDR05303.1 urease accessory protein UreD [Devosia rhodophyticola]